MNDTLEKLQLAFNEGGQSMYETFYTLCIFRSFKHL